jgi:GMP synthase (glutamine-hydrolysing)
MAKSVTVLQHFAPETLGIIEPALMRAGLCYSYIRPFAGQSVPTVMGDAAGLVVLGGPMGVYEQAAHPYLRAELQLIECALREKKPILGVCLGSQLLAKALGADVRPSGRKEIGWHDITLDPTTREDALFTGLPARFCGFHWHGDVFDLPGGAVHLASSAFTPIQAFRYGPNAYGLLFHMEVTNAIMTGMLGAFAGELVEAGLSTENITHQAAANLRSLQALGEEVFDRWVALLGPQAVGD